MFDTLTATAPRDNGRKRSLIAVSVVVHVVVLAAVMVAPFAVVTPPAPVDIMAFVAPPPVVPPPPPPPPPRQQARTRAPRPHATSTEAHRFIAPHEVPSSIVSERAVQSSDAPGVAGGVE